MSKTAYQWRLQLPKNLRNRFVKNTLDFQEHVNGAGEPRLKRKYSSLATSISRSFRWVYTPEGQTFWETLQQKAKEGKISPESKIEIPNT